MAFEAGQSGGSYPAVLNAADEEAVELFLAGRIGFTRIAELVERTLGAHDRVRVESLQAVEEVDAWARARVREVAGH
jgi:1-deoxy-D-xylulose-5-phosphate reductoisomerase